MRILQLSGDYLRGRIPRKRGREQQGNLDRRILFPLTLALKDAVLASAIASGVTAIHTSQQNYAVFPFLPFHWQGNEDTRFHHALDWNRKTAGPTQTQCPAFSSHWKGGRLLN